VLCEKGDTMTTYTMNAYKEQANNSKGLQSKYPLSIFNRLTHLLNWWSTPDANGLLHFTWRKPPGMR